jgi:hypothetical protein
VEKQGPFRGKPANWLRIFSNSEDYHDGYVILDDELNWMGVYKKGQELQVASPNIKRFSWPLFVGKRWTSRYEYQDNMGGRKHWDTVIVSVEVEDYEEIRVPAGTFEVFRMKLSGVGGTYVYYYAPAVGMFVKTELYRNPSSFLGYGQWKTELVEYSFPQKASD